uniref:Uncharacterized protein n=1 Tax=Rhizophora mucronata TaxID=61149 RepID=A0A2P2NTX7_RHIMU
MLRRDLIYGTKCSQFSIQIANFYCR